MGRLPVVRRVVKKSDKPLTTKYEKGHAGGPGRPAGMRNKATMAIMQVGEQVIDELLAKAVGLAKEGDLAAMKLIFDRVCPPPKGRPVQLDLPRIHNLKSLSLAMDKVTETMAKGEITPEEAKHICDVLDRNLAVKQADLSDTINVIMGKVGLKED